MDYSKALKLMKQGLSTYRKGWNGIEAGHEMYVYIIDGCTVQPHNKNPVMGDRPHFDLDPFFIFYHGTKKTYNMWIPSIWDIMANDWEVLEV